MSRPFKGLFGGINVDLISDNLNLENLNLKGFLVGTDVVPMRGNPENLNLKRLLRCKDVDS